MTIFYEPKYKMNLSRHTPDSARANFKKRWKLLEIKTKEDVGPVNVKVCGHDWNRVVCFEVKYQTQPFTYTGAIGYIPKCSNSGWKCEPFVFLIISFSLFLFVIT